MLKKLFSETVVYGMGTILPRLINYLLVPIHTGVLQTDSYGIVAYFYAYAALLNVLYTYGMETAFFRFVDKKEGIFDQIFTAILTTSLLFSGILIAFSSNIAAGIGFPESGNYVTWFAILIATDAILAIPFAQLRKQGKAVKFALVKISNVVLNVALNVFFLIVCRDIYEGKYLTGFQEIINTFYDPELGLGYAFLSNMIANILQIPWFINMFRQVRLRFHWKGFQPVFLYAYPLIFSGMAFCINEVADRILLKYLFPEEKLKLSSIEAIGIYSACYKLSIFITLAVQAYKYAAEPFFFAQAGKQGSPQLFARAMKFFVIVLSIMFVAVNVNLGWISDLFLRKEAYKEGLFVVPILLMGNIFLGIYYNLAVWYKVTDKTRYGAYISIGGAFFTLVLNLLLIPQIGYAGSALVTLFCYFGMAVSSYLIGQKFYAVPYDLGSAIFYLLIASVIVWIGREIQIEPQWGNFFIQNALLALFALLVLFKERNEFKQLFQRNKAIQD
ncbi:polysaccharide biosynthesis C-terminal domain-containing protein [Rapidithrix thailandica]|uniref:Polysaccharide biosynthesis C-terminal domain-containing protein n=1 Tax=Rapidithrix thailandica TaxID=413964 RepID=A0AAW9S4Q5_9BACT